MKVTDDPLREAFEEAIFREHFVKHVSIDPNKQFWDLSGQKSPEEVFERDGDDYKDPAISAMWFGWRAALQPPEKIQGRPTESARNSQAVGWRFRLDPESSWTLCDLPRPREDFSFEWEFVYPPTQTQRSSNAREERDK